MPESFRWCARHYIKQWCELDREFFLGFSRGVTCELLRKMCLKYQVDRTVPGHGLEKYRRFAEMLNGYRNIEITSDTVPRVIEEELKNMHSAYGRPFLSAITKAFWMMKRHPIVIYDSQARRGLRYYGLPPGDGNYRVYFESWWKFFQESETQKGLDNALDWLRTSKDVPKKYKVPSDEFDDLATSDWFRNRVVDIRLFYTAR